MTTASSNRSRCQVTTVDRSEKMIVRRCCESFEGWKVTRDLRIFSIVLLSSRPTKMACAKNIEELKKVSNNISKDII